MTPEQELAALISLLRGLYIGRDELPTWARMRIETWHLENERRTKLRSTP